ncbi:hypothetical protein MNBD_BACTEROID06-1551 [hydrothermal vent metagenome]|uniref:Phage tail fiber protein n=1 Tax=hydrothermal vent metagenome TaxID=652676 RepID=A0A3B0UTC1_9ZZZZ
MKTNVKKLSYLLLSLFIILASCARDGDPGPAGKDGTDGVNGTNGADGSDGSDGNANVQTFLFNAPEWEVNQVHVMNLNIPAITETVLNESVILGYAFFSSNWYSTDSYYSSGYLRSYASFELFTIKAQNNDNSSDDTPPAISIAKIIIIEPTNTTETTGNGRVAVSPQQAILNELAVAGVDINDYEQVAAYYNLQD